MIQLTESAALKVREMFRKQGAEGSSLRMGVKGGGCAGLEYYLDMAEAPNPDDRVFEQHGLKVFVDAESFVHLSGMELDYHDTLMDAGFKFNNPNASASCGCGKSFCA